MAHLNDYGDTAGWIVLLAGALILLWVSGSWLYYRLAKKDYCLHPDCTGDYDCPAHDICMCGEDMISHSVYAGHGPVSMHEYNARWTRPIPHGE